MRKVWNWLAVELVLAVLIVGLWLGFNSDLIMPAFSDGGSAAMGLVLLDSERGVYVLAVSDKSPAHLAGVQPGDVILTADETDLEDPAMLDQLLNKSETDMQLMVQRKELVVELTLTRR